MLVAQSSLLAAKSPVRTTVSMQVMKHAVRNPCKIRLQKNQSAEGATEKYLCRAFGTFYIIMVMNAGVSCFGFELRTKN